MKKLLVTVLLLLLMQSCANDYAPKYTTLIHVHYFNGNTDTLEVKGRAKPILYLTVDEGVSGLHDGFTLVAAHVASFHIVETKEIVQ